jgi:hypothetical protein
MRFVSASTTEKLGAFMKCRGFRAFALVGSISLVLAALVSHVAAAQTSEPLVQKSDLVYQGAFALPSNLDCSGPAYACFSYGGGALAYNPADNSLYIVGHVYGQLTAEVSIPPLINTTNVGDLNVATLLQPFADATDGKRNSVNPSNSNNQISGQLVYDNRLIVSVATYYDGAGTQVSSHFAHSLTLDQASGRTGPVTVGSQYPGFVDGYMALVPSEWQQLFGGPAVTGNCCLNIVSEQSNGPALSVFNPDNIGTLKEVPATPLVYYPSTNPLGSGFSSQSNLFNGTTKITGVVFPAGTRSVLFFGEQGTGPFCYGQGTSNASLAGTAVNGNSSDIWCYDPAGTAKGTHAYPYVYQVWAYDANDLLAVKNGTKLPYQIQPYAVWSFDLPFENPNGSRVIGGAAYDARDQLIYISQLCVGPACNPIVQVFKVNVGAALPPNPPSAVIVH